MISSKLKVLVVVSALVVFVGFCAVGCKKKTVDGWVNTGSLGHNFASQSVADAKQPTGIIYLGSRDGASDMAFGPEDVSFEFRDLNFKY